MSGTSGAEAGAVTTDVAVAAVAWGRAPRCLYEDGRESRINRRIICADGFKVSVQASANHYCDDSHPSGESAYWRGVDAEPAYPFITAEVGNPSGKLTPRKVWNEFDAEGVWARVPFAVVAALLDKHGGAVGWEERA